MRIVNGCGCVPFGLIFILIVDPVSSNPKCSGMVNSLGYTFPPNDIIIEYGEPLEIFCILHKNPWSNSSYLMFFRGEEKVDSRYLRQVNSTALQLYIPKPSKVLKEKYVCRLVSPRKEAICINYVTVESKPEPVRNFKCYTLEYSLTCTWNTSESERSFNQYSLKYTDAKTSSAFTNCPHMENETKCFWPEYRTTLKSLKFTMNVTNSFGSHLSTYYFNVSAIAIPDPPEHLILLASTRTSLTIKWNVTDDVKDWDKSNIEYRVRYKSQSDMKPYEKTGTLTWPIEPLLLNNLSSFINYDIEVSLRSTEAPVDPLYWSEPAKLSAWTNSTIPPPRNIRVVKTTNTTISLKWLPPKVKNRDIDYYRILYSSKELMKKAENCTNCEATLTNLRVGQDYNISLEACSVSDCSPPSPPIITETEIGNPSEIRMPSIHWGRSATGEDVIYLSWAPPTEPGGRNQTYGACLVLDHRQQCYETSELTVNITNLCGESDEGFYSVKIRAMNIDKDRRLTGPWTEVKGGRCLKRQISIPPYALVLGVLCSFVIIIMLILFCKRLKKKYYYMTNITVKLPGAMVPNEKSKDFGEHTNSWNKPHKSHACMPEETLLLRMRKVNDDEVIAKLDKHEEASSGCESGFGSGASTDLSTGARFSFDSSEEAMIDNYSRTSGGSYGDQLVPISEEMPSPTNSGNACNKPPKLTAGYVPHCSIGKIHPHEPLSS